MSEKYDINGDYYSGKKLDSEDKKEGPDGDNEENGTSTKAMEYVKALLAEKLLIDQAKMPNAAKLLEEEITKAQALGKVPYRDSKYVNIYREKPIKVTIKVLVPVREHPKFNFVGKLLGPKGNSMKRLQEETMCKMAILGRGSMKDRNKEEELRNSLDPKYSHLTDDLHVEISALGPPAEAHARVAFALAEIRKFLIPDSNDHISLQQMREMENDPHYENPGYPDRRPGYGGPGPGGPMGDEREFKPRRPMSRPAPSNIPHGRPLSGMRTATKGPVLSPRGMPAKTKIMSILDKARVAMEEGYGYEEDNSYSDNYPPEDDTYGSNSGYEYSNSKPSYSSGYHDDYEDGYQSSTSRGWKPSSYPKASSGSNPSSGFRQGDSSRYRSSPYSRPMH